MAESTLGIILNVDDNEAVRYTKTRVLRAAGFTVYQAGTGQVALRRLREVHPRPFLLQQAGAVVLSVPNAAEALALLDREAFDVLVSDIGMPGEDGYALIRSVRQRAIDAGGRIPAAALTAYARTEDRLRALAAGFQIHVPKPVQREELVTVVASLAGRIG